MRVYQERERDSGQVHSASGGPQLSLSFPLRNYVIFSMLFHLQKKKLDCNGDYMCKFCVKYFVEDLSVGAAVIKSATGDQPVIFYLIITGIVVSTKLTLGH